MVSQQALNLHFPPGYQVQDFLVAPHNENAYQWIMQWPQWPHPVSVISGPEGSGKTHLAHLWAERAQALFLTHQHFRDYEPADLVTLAQAFVWDEPCCEGIEEAMFHAYNHSVAAQKAWLMVHRRPPSAWLLSLPDLRSRLLRAVHISVLAPSDSILEALLRKLLHDYQIDLSPPVAQYILRRYPRSAHDLQIIAYRLAQHLHATHQSLTMPVARMVLEDDLGLGGPLFASDGLHFKSTEVPESIR